MKNFKPALFQYTRVQSFAKLTFVLFFIYFGSKSIYFNFLRSDNIKKDVKRNDYKKTHFARGGERARCQDCPLFHYSPEYMRTKPTKCAWKKKKTERFCSEKDKGPYLVIGPFWYGLHNNWLQIMSAFFFGQAWNKTGGTIVITGIAASRRNFSRELRDKYYPIRTTDLFDIDHSIEYMRKKFGVNVCLAKESVKSGGASLDQVFKGINRFGSKKGKKVEVNKEFFDKEGSHSKDILNFIPSSGEVTLYNKWQWGWGGKYRASSPDLTDIHDFHLTEKRESALALCYSREIREISWRSRKTLRKQFPYKKIVGLHVRLEGDMHMEGLSYKDVSKFLEPYETQIEKYKSWSPYNVTFYVAHGSLEGHVKDFMIEWFEKRHYNYVTKESTLKGRELARLKRMTPDAQAGVDAETLVHLDHFIGYGGSTMSVVVLERRRYFGKSATMGGGYGDAPIFVPGKSAFWP